MTECGSVKERQNVIAVTGQKILLKIENQSSFSPINNFTLVSGAENGKKIDQTKIN